MPELGRSGRRMGSLTVIRTAAGTGRGFVDRSFLWHWGVINPTETGIDRHAYQPVDPRKEPTTACFLRPIVLLPESARASSLDAVFGGGGKQTAKCVPTYRTAC